MTTKQLVLELCRREGLKKQSNIAQMTEIVGHLADICYEKPFTPVRMSLYKLGKERTLKRIKAKKAEINKAKAAKKAA